MGFPIHDRMNEAFLQPYLNEQRFQQLTAKK